MRRTIKRAKSQRAKSQRAKSQRAKSQRAKSQRAKSKRAKSKRAKSQSAKSKRAKSQCAKSQRGGDEPNKKAKKTIYSQIAKNPDILPGVVLTAAAFVTGPVWMCTLGTLGLATNKLRHQYKN
jgi:DNA mismatch repair ATPase MutL